MRIRFIINPIAGGNPNLGRTLDSIGSFAKSTGAELDWAVSQAAGDMKRLAEEAVLGGVDIVAAVGGDGSVNEVASALIGTDSALGIIPIGSGNGLARHLGIPMSINEAAHILLDGRRKKIDCGLVNGMPFFCTAGVGFDAKVGMDYALSNHRGLVTYVRKALKGWLPYKPSQYILTVDGIQQDLQASIITVANANQWGNNFHIAPHASISDGMLDITIIHDLKRISAIRMPIQILGYRIDHNSSVTTLVGRHISIKSSQRGFWHVDGESFVWSGEKLDIDIIPQALSVIA